MRFHLVYAAVGLAGAFGVPAAQAQTMIATQPAPAVIAQPPLATALAAVVQPAETVRTTRTVHTVRTLVPVRERIVTTRTVTRSVMPADSAVVAPTVAAVPAPQALYNVAPAATVAPAADIYSTPAYDYADRAPGYDYAPPLYNVAPAPVVTAPAAVAPAPVVAAPVVSAPVLATQPVIYRYVYEPDRILVVDPTTNIAVQAIPR